MMRIFIFLLLVTQFASAATYYVSTTGNDSNDGSVGTPWLTIGKAVTNLVAGDIAIVNAGIYNPEHNGAFTQADGTSNSPIHLKSATAGTVTNQGNFDIQHDWWIIDGLTFTALNTDNTCCYIHSTADYFVFTNNLVTHVRGQGPVMETHWNPYTASQYCLIVSNVFDTMTNGIMGTQLMGVGHIVKGNVIKNGYAVDAFYPFGTNHQIIGNTLSNLVEEEGYGNHPDILQLFGDTDGWGNGGYGNNILFERNTVVNCPIQFLQLTQDGVQLNSNLLFINNLFLNSNLQGTIDFTGVKFYNNTWYHCNFTLDSLFQYTWYGSNYWEYTNYQGRGLAYGGEFKNNAMIECSRDNYNYSTDLTLVWDAGTTNWIVNYEAAMDPETDVVPDYDYICWTNYAAKGTFSEVNGINGGTPVYGDVTAGDYSIPTNSLLRQAGTPLAEVIVDFNGVPRLNPPSIGAFEFTGETPAPGRHDIPSTIIMFQR